jgi:LmbE family N-acetylglucosaminyl deacetylase
LDFRVGSTYFVFGGDSIDRVKGVRTGVMEVHWAIIVQLLILPGLVIVGALIYSRLLCSPSIDTARARDLLILAAHPDDCAIVAGEYAQVMLAGGCSVRVVYLTCGSRLQDDDRGRARREEAIAAWAIAGVPPENLIFLGYPHTDAATGAAPTPAMLDEAVGRLADIFRSLPLRARIFFPADGESHPDHRSLRDVALKAFQRVGRQDVETIEAPEYNPYLSLARSPARSLLYVIARLPLICRLVDRQKFVPPPSFFEGPPGLVLPPDSDRLATKCRMLRRFTSENQNDILVRHFGFPDHYRPFDPSATSNAATGKWFMRIGDRFLSPGIITWWLTLWTMLLVLLYLAGKWKVRWLGAEGLFGNSAWAIGITAFVGVALLSFALIRRHSLERRVTIFVAGTGLIAGGLAAEEFLVDMLVK